LLSRSRIRFLGQEVSVKKAIAPMFVALSFALPAFCFAQEAPPASPAPADAAPPAAPVAPAPADPQLVVVPIPAAPLPVELTREERRRLTLHEREVTRLLRVMEKEGNEFSQERYESYGNRVSGGTVLLVLGGGSVLAGLIYMFYSIKREIDDIDWYAEDDEYSEEDDYETKPGIFACLLVAGAVGIGVGAALVGTGRSGRKRQEMLRRKDEILGPFSPRVGVTLSFFTDPRSGANGLALRATV
jgi:hypothetical protein